MTIPVPNLDDRTFADLVLQARRYLVANCPEWTDLSVHDPGMVLVEAFAHLTEVMLYRMNRLPERAYSVFLNLLGVSRQPPAAAYAELTFTRTGSGTPALAIPAGLRVSTAGGDGAPVVFTVPASAVLAAGQAEVRVPAYHCEPVEAELLGVGTGAPGQVLRTRSAPLVSTTEPYDVLLGVAAGGDELGPGVGAREHAGTSYVIWQPVDSFAGAGPRDRVYRLDRETGTVTFAPALQPAGTGRAEPLAAVPAAGREVRIWYRTGGGPAGNVASGQLTVLRDPLPGVRVENVAPARGGRAMESLDAAVVRGPYQFYSQLRAVTARDFELLATGGGASVARARAFTRSSMWSFARPGQVEVVLVPEVGEQARPGWRLPPETLVEQQVPAALAATQAVLDSRRPLGTTVVSTWARYKSVSVRGRVVVRAQEDPDAVRARIHDRLYQVISVLPTPANASGWAFGEPLRASNVYRLLELAEPGVRYVDDVRFVVQKAPDAAVRGVRVDNFQPDTWYAGGDETLFRSTNGGRGWEAVGTFPGEVIRRVVPAPAPDRTGVTARPGHVAVVTRTAEGGSVVYLSSSLGEEWTRLAALEPAVNDLDWIDRDGAAALLLATDSGLYELALLPGSVPLQVLVDAGHADRGFYAVRAFVSERGVRGVALAGQALSGVYLSTVGGASGTFENVGLSRVDTRTLAVQYDGPATLLWVGAGESDVTRPGNGAYRARLFEATVRWEQLNSGWAGGTCWDFAFGAGRAYAATQSGGVLRLDLAGGAWQSADVNSGLPLRDRSRFAAIQAVAVAGDVVMAGGAAGVHRSTGAVVWETAAARESQEVVTVPDTWLLCSGEHDIEVVSESAQ
ncbi:MAG TPA: baseplate J/gp47 family protein [Rugosimonospora sp.]|nr:baseplate J/gp47 family protein [Rugosimonospora sp.]